MRITTQMLNEQAKRSGLPINHSTLLDYINTDKKSNSLFDTLNSKKTDYSNATQKNNYEKLEKLSDELLNKIVEFLDEDDNSIFGKLNSNENFDENKNNLYDSVESLVESYNKTSKQIKSAGGTLNSYYSKMLKEAVTDSEKELEAIGISVNSDGTLSLNKDKLKSSDIDSIKKVLGGSETFLVKTAIVVSGVSKNANANVASASNQYNSSGSTYAASNNKYDFWG